jgi:hypothetical protein
MVQEKLEKKPSYENLKEPENLYILSNNEDALLLTSKEMDVFLNKLKNIKYDKKLAKFYSKFDNNIVDMTKE